MGHLKKSASGHLLKTTGGHLVKECAGPGCPDDNCVSCTENSLVVTGFTGADAQFNGTYLFQTKSACWWLWVGPPPYPTTISAQVICVEASGNWLLKLEDNLVPVHSASIPNADGCPGGTYDFGGGAQGVVS